MKKQNLEKMDLTEKPRRHTWYTNLLAKVVCFVGVHICRLRIHRYNMENVKPPYIILGNHQSFIDFMVTVYAFKPYNLHIVGDPEAFLKKENLVRDYGVLITRKFIDDVRLVKHIKYTLSTLKEPVVVYPEARFSMVGTPSELPDSIIKMLKVMKVPVVMINMKGNYLSMPVWNQLPPRFNRVEADITQIITDDEIHQMNVEQIRERVDQAFAYDEYQWQFDHHIKIGKRYRASGLHHVLYQCPNCNAEYHMISKHTTIACNACNKKWQMDKYGVLNAVEGKTEFTRIPDWFEWQRSNVIAEIANGAYRLDTTASIESYPNPKGYISHGIGHITQTIEDGFALTFDYYGERTTLTRTPLEMYSVPVKFPFFHYKSGFALSFPDNSYYIYPETTDFSPTKVMFATEEINRLAKEHVRKQAL